MAGGSRSVGIAGSNSQKAIWSGAANRRLILDLA